MEANAQDQAREELLGRFKESDTLYEVDVQIKASDLYDYMLRHTYYSATGLIGTIVGALLIVGYFYEKYILFLIFGVVVILYLPWTLFLKSRQQALTNPAFKKPLHFRFTELGIEVSQDESVECQEWQHMYKAVSTMRSIILYTSPVKASIFPRSILGQDSARLIEIISTHMPPAKVKIRS